MEQHGRRLRIDGWGFEDEHFEPSPAMLAWLERRVGPPGTALSGGRARVAPPRNEMPNFAIEASTDERDRLYHARGQGLADILRLRSGVALPGPDAILRPADADQVAAALETCARHDVAVIPWGGGTSVTGGVNPPDDGRPVVALNLEHMRGLMALDEISGLAVFGPGTTGPEVEQVLAAHDLTLGHFPQSWELSTVGGWVATRSSGQESSGYGRIEDMVAGLELVAPEHRMTLPALPASAAGPDLRQLIMGSEGRLGVITEATLRVRPRPEKTVVEAYLLPNIEHGIEASRDLTRSGLPLCLVRVSDAPETQVALAIGLGRMPAAPLVRGYLRLRGIGDEACLMLVGTAGTGTVVEDALEMARARLTRHRAVRLGRGPGRHWQRDRFRHPYLREALLDRGWATDTLETAVPWSRAASTRDTVRSALEHSLVDLDERVAALCHISHPYTDGTSLYFTFFFRTADDPDATTDRWARAKRAASEALVASGATITHHHGVGRWHAPWLEAEIGPTGRRLLEAAAQAADPAGILNPQILLDPTDRLEA
jgi:alkyldihydroxyacetonephosphate synthase